MRKLITLIIFLLIILWARIAHTEFQASGYYNNFFTTIDSPLPDTPMMGVVANRLRLNLSYAATESFSFAIAYDFSPRIQDPSLFTESPIAVGIASSRYRVADFDSLLYPDDNEQVGSVGIYHNLDRASVQISTDYADISIGRDAIAWGSARIINPTDVVAPFNYDQLDTEDRVGVDAVRVRIPVGVLGEVDTGYIFGTDFDFNKSAIYLRTLFNTLETDYSIGLIEYQNDLLFGLDIARGIGGAGFWFEMSYVLAEAFDGIDSKNNYIRTSVGLDYSFGGETYTFVEYHYNGAGTEKPDNYLDNLNHSAYTRGGVYLLGVHYLAPGLTHQLTPLTSISGQMLFNLSDLSTWFAPQLAYNIAEDIHISVGGFISLGKQPKNDDPTQFQSEFGSYPNLFFTSFRVYY
ncbi:hypothetical protein F4212_02660 [Candidatus Poribacteria bacterium]|nr:hypothetical protein [Candidatus Poribacteria bacterium]